MACSDESTTEAENSSRLTESYPADGFEDRASVFARSDTMSEAYARYAKSQQRLDAAISAYLEYFGGCVDERTCDDRGIPRDLILDLEGHVALIESVATAVLAFTEVNNLAGPEKLEALGDEWREATFVAVRAATSMLVCMSEAHLVSEEEHDDYLHECVRRRQLYSAALIDANRLSSEFKAEFSAILDASE